jgi:hypothetical protein
MPEAQPMFDRIRIDVEQLRLRCGLYIGHDPGDVDIDHQYQVGLIDQGIAAVAKIMRMVAGKIDILRTDFTDA